MAGERLIPHVGCSVVVLLDERSATIFKCCSIGDYLSEVSVLYYGRYKDCMKKALFITTIGMVKESGGVRYSKSILDAMGESLDVSVLVLSDIQYFRSRLLRFLFSLFVGLLRRVPPNVAFHSGLFLRIPKELLAAHWDVLVIDHLEAAVVAKRFKSRLKIYVAHNIESDLIDFKLSRFPFFARKLYQEWVKSFEVDFIQSVNGVVTISSAEAGWFKMLCKDVVTIYPIFKASTRLKFSSTRHCSKLRLGFLGEAGWGPNREAVDVLVDKILPLVSRDVDVVFAGAGWGNSQTQSLILNRQPKCSTFEFPGYIPDIKDYWASIDVFVAPILSGAGVNVKICEALANGVFVIALPHAIRGLNDRILGCGGVAVVDTNNAFAAAIDRFDMSDADFQPPVEFSQPYSRNVWASLLQKLAA